MMNKCFSLAVLIALAAFGIKPVRALGQTAAGSSPILSATQQSGYTTAELASEHHCEVQSDGSGTGYVSTGFTDNGWAHTQSFTFKVSEADLNNLKLRIADAQAGTIANGPSQCDSGSTDISARADSNTSTFVIVKAMDCDQTHVNQAASARSIRQFVATECKIQY